MRCFLSERNRQHFEQRAAWSAVSEESREGYFRLFNKNGFRTTFVRIVDQTPNRYGWIVDVDEPVDPYFTHVLIAEDDEGAEATL